MIKHFIRELSDSDWQEYKVIRLKSLLDSPDSFGSTYEREAPLQTEQWKARLKVSPSIHDAVTFASVEGGMFIGLLSCVIHDSSTRSAHLYQMWVSPEYRGNGVGTALVDQVKKWAYDRNIEKLVLTVTTTNTDAISLYKKAGFEAIGATELLRLDSNLQSQVMEATRSRD